jgi:MarR-like DNA-binding transcriptional regulator SgrR of sgrS sRNA
MQSWLSSLDPSAREDAVASSRLLPLVFDRLVDIDTQGVLSPALATAWTHDGRQWTFVIRPGVKFHDGSPLTTTDIAASLAGYQSLISETAVAVQSTDPDLPRVLSRMAFSIRKSGNLGTGPFRVKEFVPDRRVVLSASDTYWQGRPFVDEVQIEMGRALKQQRLDLELGRADVVDLAPEARNLFRFTAASQPLELVALVFNRMPDASVREALSYSIDRPALHTVVAQRSGTPAGSLLPQWITGYAHLFPAGRDLGRAQLKAGDAPPPITLQSDPIDPLARLISERVAVNAREARITIRPPQPGIAADCRLIRIRILSPDSLEAARGLATSLEIEPPASRGALLDWERSLLESHRVIPLLHLPEVFGLSARVRNWRGYPWGGWLLADVWIAEGLDSRPSASALLLRRPRGLP